MNRSTGSAINAVSTRGDSPFMALIAVMIFFSPVTAQEKDTWVSDGRQATLEALPPPPPYALGYPDRCAEFDVLPGFLKPPHGYGQVPFFWWPGDPLTKERLGWQLDRLQEAGVQGMTVSYNHSHFLADPELNRDFIGPHGRTHAGDPPVFSEEWWEIWKWFSAETGQRNMGLGLKDYTFNFSGYWHDEVRHLPGFSGYRGNLHIREISLPREGEILEYHIGRDTTVAVTVYRVTGGGIASEGSIDLLPFENNGVIRWKVPAGKWRAFESVTLAGEAFMLHPEHGQEHRNRYFQRFEDRMDDEGRRGMNYFLQDELDSPANIVGPLTWAEDFPEQFKKRKGYDLLPYIPALTNDLGTITAKIRLDHMDVVMDLVEERFYKPIFDWHWKRGLIYGGDNWGRGLNPKAYGDYFRATRWFTAPGNDAPGRGESFIQTKVSSSVAHLYQRPRVWLEAFHSIGWDTYPDELTEQIDRHYLFGGNFLNLHGLYYTLHGGWWEWAPPCFHFRMPYWPHFRYLLEYSERLSYLLSHGQHVADVALIYPVSPMQADPDHKPETAFETGKELFNAGIDFTFIDYQSLARAEAGNGTLNLQGNSYPVLILADLPAVRFTTLTRALEHFRSGGIVLAVGKLPGSSDRAGSDDPEVDNIVKELFGITAAEALSGRTAAPRRSNGGGLGMYFTDPSMLAPVITSEITRDFIPPSGRGRVLHRKVGVRDVYMVMEVPAGEECFFRSTGKAELWDAWTGNITELPVIRQTEEGTILRIPVQLPRSSIIVFSPGSPLMEQEATLKAGDGQERLMKSPDDSPGIIPLDGLWDFELVPTLDNRWGDFRLPASEEIIGAEARELHYMPVFHSGSNPVMQDEADKDSWPLVRYSFGPQMYRLHAADTIDFDSFVRVASEDDPRGSRHVEIDGNKFTWEPYEFSWRQGVLDQPGSQGWHGLKGRVEDRFIILDDDGHFIFSTFLTLEKETGVEVLIEGVRPEIIMINNKPLSGDKIMLTRGTHLVLLGYRNATRGRVPGGRSPIDLRERSAVVFVAPEEGGQSAPGPLSMKWHNRQDLLPFNYHGDTPVEGHYRFLSPPGFEGMEFTIYGIPEAFVDGRPVALQSAGPGTGSGQGRFSLSLEEPRPLPVWVELRVRHIPGFYGGAAFPEPVRIAAGRGKIPSGDWSQMGVLHHYSGGIRYGKDFSLTAAEACGKVTLDLGEVIATCEVRVNSQPAGILINSPFVTDITPYIRPGTNHIEVLVYNTLSNHYQTIPSPYRGNPASGIMGPARIITGPAADGTRK